MNITTRVQDIKYVLRTYFSIDLIEIYYAASNNAPVITKDGNLIHLTADKMPIGKGERTEPFTLHTLDHSAGDVLYLYTDGFADQFGGPKGKKYKYKQLDELLLSIHSLPLHEQSRRLNESFENWKGTLKQVDDVAIIGIQLG